MEEKWNDQLEILGDARQEVNAACGSPQNSFEQNLLTPEDIAEYEKWLDFIDV